MNKPYDQGSGEMRVPHPGGRFIVYHTRSGRTLLAPKPRTPSERGPRSAKITLQESVCQAAAYAEFASKQNIYECKAAGSSLSAYHLAMVDYLGKPQVLDIDVRGWAGGSGQQIRIRARDNFLVLSVRLVIRDREIVWESGEATQSESDRMLWTYITQTPVLQEPGLQMDAYAYDLPGNAGMFHLDLR